jgi:hypothetical protein
MHFKTILHKAESVIKKRKLDLALSEQNSEGKVSTWFTPTSADFALSSYAQNILFPIRIEWRGSDDISETGTEIPLVNYQVLNESYGAASFYGSPLRMVFRDPLETVQMRQFRIAYETDFTDSVDTNQTVHLPEYFTDFVANETTILLLPLVEDNSPEWEIFYKRQMPVLENDYLDWAAKWKDFVRSFKGRSNVPKRTFLDRRNGGSPYRIRRF